MRKVGPVGRLGLVCLLAALAGCSRTVNDGFADAATTARVVTVILNDPVIGSRGIDVATQAGVVTLTGVVRDEAERQQAVALVYRVDGIVEVRDALQIVPAD